MKSDIVIIGAGASGLMAAYSAGKTAVDAGKSLQITLLEKMPRAGRKIMITGKGRCNFTNLKEWNEFCTHIQAGSRTARAAFYTLPPSKVIDFFESFGMGTVVERGDRAFPSSHHASDVVDTLVNACHSVGVKTEYDCCVNAVRRSGDGFEVCVEDGRRFSCKKLIIATGGLSYPATGSTGDGYVWAQESGHRIVPTFPALTALVPYGYKTVSAEQAGTVSQEGCRKQKSGCRHIDRGTPLSETGEKLCGIQLKNVQLTLYVQDCESGTEFGDVDFTDGGIEGPIGFSLSRKAVKAMANGSKVSLSLDLKPGVDSDELAARVEELWGNVCDDPRSRRLKEKEKCRILLGKLMPWELIPAFMECNPDIIVTAKRGGRYVRQMQGNAPGVMRGAVTVSVKIPQIAAALKNWRFDIQGYVGYERAVITAGGISTDDIIAKTLESRLVPGLYFCGEVLDIDADTGGYNLQLAFCTGALAGASAAANLQ